MNLWDELEEFTQGASSSRTSAPRISLNNRGDLTLNQKAYGLLKEAKKVILAYSKLKRVIGIRPAKDDEKHAFEVKALPKSTSYVIRSKNFCNYHEIIPTQTVAFDKFQSDDTGVILDLNNVTVLAPRNSTKKTAEQTKQVAPPLIQMNETPKTYEASGVFPFQNKM